VGKLFYADGVAAGFGPPAKRQVRRNMDKHPPSTRLGPRLIKANQGGSRWI